MADSDSVFNSEPVPEPDSQSEHKSDSKSVTASVTDSDSDSDSDSKPPNVSPAGVQLQYMTEFVSNKPQHVVPRHDNHPILYSSNKMQEYDMS